MKGAAGVERRPPIAAIPRAFGQIQKLAGVGGGEEAVNIIMAIGVTARAGEDSAIGLAAHRGVVGWSTGAGLVDFANAVSRPAPEAVILYGAPRVPAPSTLPSRAEVRYASGAVIFEGCGTIGASRNCQWLAK